jgi:hypothetical protein
VTRRIAILIVLLAACSREQKAPPPATPVRPAPKPAVSTVVPPSAPQTGSYEAVVERFRLSKGFHFTFNGGEGLLERPRQGMERVKIRTGHDAWTAEVKPNGVVWTKNGKHELNVPQSLQQLFQRVTIFPDPQKKEGSAQRIDDTFTFTNANGGEHYVVKVVDGNIVELNIDDQTVTFRF